MIGLFGTSVAGSYLLEELRIGSFERFLVTPLDRSSLLIGRALKEVVPLILQGILIVLVVTPFGFRLEPAGIAIGLLLLAIFGVGLGALSHSLALAVRKQEYLFWLIQQTFLFPLLLLSGILLPLDGAPDWLVALSKLNPLSYLVDRRAGPVRRRPERPVDPGRGGRRRRRGHRRSRPRDADDAALGRLTRTLHLHGAAAGRPAAAPPCHHR